MLIKKMCYLLCIIILSMAAINPAYSKGCIKGAIVGGITGHFAGHHGLLGAAAGCAILHHEESKKNKLNPSTQPNQSQYTNPYKQNTPPQKGVTHY